MFANKYFWFKYKVEATTFCGHRIMESFSTGQLPPKSPHTVTTDPSEINSANYNQPSLQKDEAILTNRNATSSILREHIQKLEELYKRVVYQCEENRLKYWIALNELENCRIFQKISCKSGKKGSEKCDKQTFVVDGQSKRKNSVLPLHSKISNEINKSSEIKPDQNIQYIKQRSAPDLKIQFIIEKRTKNVCNCGDQCPRFIPKNLHQKKSLFINIKDSITKKLKEENEDLKHQIVVLKQKLNEQQSYISMRSSKSEIMATIPEENTQFRGNKQNSILEENGCICGEDSFNEEKKSIPVGSENIQEIESIEVNPDYLKLIPEIHTQNTVNGKLINEILFQLQELQKNMESIRKTLDEHVTPKPESENETGNTEEEKQSNTEMPANVKTEKDVVRIRCDVATNCISFCICETDCKDSDKYDLENYEVIQIDPSDIKNTEIGQENLNADLNNV